ncbi:MAG: hypothetical protein P4L84_31855 [Isosphaeraceae bacterium]|nr:hypothetical protein [Isosphaeraceae bacterium]
MRKLVQPLLDDGPGVRRWKYSSAMTILVGILLSPLAYESGLLCYSRWSAMAGATHPVKTPVLDAIGRAYESARDDIREFSRPVTRHTTWSASFMIPFVMVCMVIGVLLLRK